MEANEQVVLRRNGLLLGGVCLFAAVLAAGYAYAALTGGGILAVVVAVGLTVVAKVNFNAYLDARLPLFVADDTGVRFRDGRQWQGLPWESIDRVVVQPRRGLLRDGRIVVRLDDDVPPPRDLSPAAQRSMAAAQRRFGAPYAIPFGFATSVSVADVPGALSRLADGRTQVTTLRPEPEAQPVAAGVDDVDRDDSGEASDEWLVPGFEPRDADEPVAAEERVGAYESVAADEPAAEEAVSADQPGHEEPVPRDESAADGPVPDEPVRDPSPAPTLATRSPQSRAWGASAVPIGATLADARRRIGPSIQELSERTRIRAHVIEAIEADDFSYCGGDFYARGHIRTLARILGVDPGPLVAEYDATFASAPVGPRTVFEAELATASQRRRSGSPNWGAVVGVVLAVLLVWGVVRLVAGTGEPQTTVAAPTATNTREGSDRNPPTASARPTPTPRRAPTAVRIKVVAQFGESWVEVADRKGVQRFAGLLGQGERRVFTGQRELSLELGNAGAVLVYVNGRSLGSLGAAGEVVDVTITPRGSQTAQS